MFYGWVGTVQSQQSTSKRCDNCVNTGPILWRALPCGTAFQPWGQSIWGGERSDGLWLPTSLCWSIHTFLCSWLSSCVGLDFYAANNIFVCWYFPVYVRLCSHRMIRSKQTLVVWKISYEMSLTALCPFQRPSAPWGNPLLSGIARLAPWRYHTTVPTIVQCALKILF